MSLQKYGFIEINHDKLQEAKAPYKVYAELLEEEAQEQFLRVLKEPYVTYGALMPDAHTGYLMPIGGVCSAKDMIVPQFVGFDIGCGMCAYKTNWSKEDIESKAKDIYEKIVSTIPLGFNRHKNHQSLKLDLPLTDFANHMLQSVGLRQIGTLGGGNHFIEIGYGKDGKAWIVIHSGSRGFGHKIASHYILQAFLQKNPQEEKLEQIAEDWERRNVKFKEANPEGYKKALVKYKIKQQAELNKKAKIDNIKEILPLDVNTPLGRDYIMDQKFALEFALENRKRMISVINDILNELLGANEAFEYEDEERFINRNHNHAEFNEKRGEWIHRKGATHAEAGMRGVIPGNMRDGSFVVIGKGNSDSLESSSHGAGRVYSRKQAKKNITLEEFECAMEGIVGTIDENTIDESPFAYKNIFEVMELQEDLVEVVEHIKPIINVKDSQKSRY